MDTIMLGADEIPATLRAWLDERAQARLLVELIVLEDGSLGLRVVPGVDPALIERALVTITKYHEALINLT
jgi:hypothetical protein